MQRGEVYLYNFLWQQEAARGEEAGRKTRPCCLLIRSKGYFFVFPLTTKTPAPERAFLEVPYAEQLELGLSETSYLILDEANYGKEDQLYDFENTKPIALLSDKFTRRALAHLRGVIQKRSLVSTPR